MNIEFKGNNQELTIQQINQTFALVKQNSNLAEIITYEEKELIKASLSGCVIEKDLLVIEQEFSIESDDDINEARNKVSALIRNQMANSDKFHDLRAYLGTFSKLLEERIHEVINIMKDKYFLICFKTKGRQVVNLNEVVFINVRTKDKKVFFFAIKYEGRLEKKLDNVVSMRVTLNIELDYINFPGILIRLSPQRREEILKHLDFPDLRLLD